MEFYLKTKEEYDNIVASSEAFYRNDRVIEGQNVAIYDYRLASLTDFTDNEAFEMRGLTFVQNTDGTWTRHILMNKFFNVNQTIGWMYDDVKDKEIVGLANKEDGSIISFVKFENGKILAKSKTSFDSEQAEMSNEVYNEREDLRKFIDYTIENDLTAIFELVSPHNQVVLEYRHTDLVLLQVRDNMTGEYLTNGELAGLTVSINVNIAEQFPPSMWNLDDLLVRKELDDSDIEGWIVTFEDGQMAKIKTDKYLQLHHLIGPDAFRENLLIKTILDNNIDDVIAQIVDGEKKRKVIDMSEVVQHHFNHLVVEYKRLRGEYFNKYGENRKEFALKYSRTHELFGAVMKGLNKGDFKVVEKLAEDAVKEHMLKRANGLNDAKEYLKSIGAKVKSEEAAA